MVHHQAAILSLLLISMMAVEATSQDKKIYTIQGWGEVVDPDGDCQTKLDGTRVIITVPGTPHDLSAELKKVNAPRIIRDIEGDFIAQVLVSGKVHPGFTGTVQPRLPFNGAGLLLWRDPENYVRLERAAIIQGNQFIPYALFEVRSKGRPSGSPSFQIPDKDTYLRLERRGTQVFASVSPNGIQWQSFQPLSADLPSKLKVGVAAVNTATDPFTAQLEKLEIFVKEKIDTEE